MSTTAGDRESLHRNGARGFTFLTEETASVLLPDLGLDIGILGGGSKSDPDSMRVFPVSVDKKLCSHCLACVKLCPSLTWDASKSQVIVNEVSCKGCGICGSVCPAGAISQRQFGTAMVFGILDDLWGGDGAAREIRSCSDCPVTAVSLGGRLDQDKRGESLRILCSGRVEPIHVLESAQAGVGGVVMIDCFRQVKEKNRFERGKARMDRGARLLRTLGIEGMRIEAVKITGRNIAELPAVLGGTGKVEP